MQFNQYCSDLVQSHSFSEVIMWPTLLASNTPAPKEKELWKSLPGPTWQHQNKKQLCAANYGSGYDELES